VYVQYSWHVEPKVTKQELLQPPEMFVTIKVNVALTPLVPAVYVIVSVPCPPVIIHELLEELTLQE
jgi:hypothetical protein